MAGEWADRFRLGQSAGSADGAGPAEAMCLFPPLKSLAPSLTAHNDGVRPMHGPELESTVAWTGGNR